MMMVTGDPKAAALAAHPELERLLRLDAAGWTWMPPPVDDEGRPTAIHGLRMWPLHGEVDALRILASTDASALRCDPDGGILWRAEGGLKDVVDRLLHLPPPGSPYAPRLVVGTAPKDLWLP